MQSKQITFSLLGIAMAVSILFYACRKEASPSSDTTATKLTLFGSKPAFKINYVPAKTNNELISLRADQSVNIVRTLGDFDRIVNSYNSPLSKLTQEQIASFRSELVVREGVGIVGFNYKKLSNYLSKEDFNSVIAFFGLDGNDGFWGFSTNPKVIQAIQTQVHSVRGTTTIQLMEDYKEYWCRSAHNCEKNSTYICLTGC